MMIVLIKMKKLLLINLKVLIHHLKIKIKLKFQKSYFLRDNLQIKKQFQNLKHLIINKDSKVKIKNFHSLLKRITISYLNKN